MRIKELLKKSNLEDLFDEVELLKIINKVRKENDAFNNNE